MTKNLGGEGVASIFDWAFLAKYLPRFLTMCNLDFVRPDKGEQGLAYEIFNTFCEWLDGTVCYFLGTPLLPTYRPMSNSVTSAAHASEALVAVKRDLPEGPGRPLLEGYFFFVLLRPCFSVLETENFTALRAGILIAAAVPVDPLRGL